MFNPEKPNLNKPEFTSAEDEQEKTYESGNVTFFAESAQNSYQHKLAKSITESIAPYMDHKIHVRYKKMKTENPGFNSKLNPKFRDENYHDSVTVNSNYQHQDELPFSLSHELGHSFEEKLEQMIKNKGLEALPVGIDDEYADFYADLIAVYILKPDLLKKLEGIPAAQNTLSAIQEMFDGENFTELRVKLDALSSQEIPPAPNSREEAEKKERIAKLFERVFVKINEYISQQK